MGLQLSIPSKPIAQFCQRWQITELAVFGSAVRSDFRADSDLDIMVTFHPAVRHSLFDLVHMQEELKQIVGREVDLVSRRGIEASRNHFRKDDILSSALVVYAA